MNNQNSFQNKRAAARKRGQTLAEYALIIAFISVVAIAALLMTSGQVSTAFGSVDHQIAVAGNGGPAASAPGR